MRIIEFLPQKKKKSIIFFLVFLSSGISQPVLLRLHLSLPGMSFAHVHRPSFVPLRSRSVASRLSLVSPQVFFHPDHCRLPADSLWFRPLPDHCRLPADNFLLLPLFSCHPGTVGCQPTFFGYAPGIVPSSPQSVASRLC